MTHDSLTNHHLKHTEANVFKTYGGKWAASQIVHLQSMHGPNLEQDYCAKGQEA